MAVRRTTRTTKKAVPAQPKTKTAPKKRVASQRTLYKNAASKPNATTLVDYFRLGESYTGLVLGIIVVIVAAILLVSLFKTRSNTAHLVDNQKGTTSISTIAQELSKITPTSVQTTTSVPTTTRVTPTVTKAPTPTETATPTKAPTQAAPNQSGQKTYTVKPGDDLWKIAESQYHDGYQWVAIAKANNLTNPGVINVGNTLTLPSITSTPTQAAQQDQVTLSGPKITGNTYVIMHGDDLWSIAVRAYGDGYKWTDIAKANNLTSPDLIFSGNTLKIPR